MTWPTRTIVAAWLCVIVSPAWGAVEPAPEAPRLPTGVRLDPAGRSVDVGTMALGMALAPDGRRVVLLLSGWRERGLEVVDLETGRVVQHIEQPAAFLGLAFAPDGRTLYASGGDEDAVYRYAWRDGEARPDGRLVLAPKEPKKNGTRHPAGLALSPDGRRLYVAENVSDSLAVVDLRDGSVVQRLPTGHYPCDVAVARDGRVFVSAWGGDGVDVFVPASGGTLAASGRIAAGRHPSALRLNRDGSRLFVASGSTDSVAVLDTRARREIAHLSDAPPSGPAEGSTPAALALSPDGTRLYVAEADANAVAVFELSARTAGVRVRAGASDRLLGRVPTGWYPAALLARGDGLLVASAKGRGTQPNPQMLQPGPSMPDGFPHYVLGALRGTLDIVSQGDLRDLEALTRRVARANGWDRERTPPRYPPFRHVIYVIKENRTYDQVLSDLPQGDGDPSLLFFPREVSPNHHALVERFGLFDRFFTNAEVSAQGHAWSTAAYVTDFAEKTTPTAYAFLRPDVAAEDDVDEPARGFLWDEALAHGLDVRIYGELAAPVQREGETATAWRSLKARLESATSSTYPSFDMTIPDQVRADAWLREFEAYVAAGRLPALQVVQLPGDHTSGARAGRRTPRAHMADNDLALARMVEAVSRSPFWRDTVIFSVEDDAQSGPDHVDSHRSVLLAISAWSRAGVYHRFANTTDVVATIEEILGLESLSQFDHHGRPLREIFAAEPDLRPYEAIVPAVPLDEVNPPQGAAAAASLDLDLDAPDASDDETFNRILWAAIKGEQAPMPPPTRLPMLEYVRAAE